MVGHYPVFTGGKHRDTPELLAEARRPHARTHASASDDSVQDDKLESMKGQIYIYIYISVI